MASCRNYFNKTGRRISFEYALIDGLNDSREAAQSLAKLVKPLGGHVNLIPVNPTNKGRLMRAPANIKTFHERLIHLGINATIRRTLGADINAACGQLRGTSTEIDNL
jgi:23S rRNA (adenine2503-C2)-methyltransferase